MEGTVYKSTGSWYQIKCNDGSTYECRIKGKYRLKDVRSTNPVAVGDQVIFELEESAGSTTGVITDICDRKNYIVRKSVNLSKQLHIIAANIDQVFLLVTIDNPVTTTSFIDRFLVTAEAYEVPAVLLFSKADTYQSKSAEIFENMQKIYTRAGYACFQISAHSGLGIAQLKTKMNAKVSMFAGHSGVGKSTLINALEPSLDLRTKELSVQHMQGQHTTTFAEMYDLHFGAKIIDTPGIRGFGLVDMEKSEMCDYFPELFKIKAHCKFNNCMHKDEPNCAVKNAVETGEIASSRYKSYLQILAGEEESYRTDFFENDQPNAL